jgi:hypothetical protein
VNSHAIPPACPGSLRAPRLSLAGTPGATRTQGLAGAPIRYAQRTTSCYLYPGKAPRDPHDAHSCESCRQTVSIGRRGTFAGRVGNEAEPGRGSWALLRNRFRATNTGPARVSRRKRMEGDFSGEDREGAGCQCSGPLPAQSRLEGLLLLTAIGGAKAQEGSTSDAFGGERSNVPRSAAFCRRRSTLQGPLAISRTVALRCWGSCPYPRLQATTSGAALTSKPISGGSTWVTPHRCAARRRFSS